MGLQAESAKRREQFDFLDRKRATKGGWRKRQ